MAKPVEPLEFCKDFPAIAQRFEAWWAGENFDRPIFLAAANTEPGRPITRRLDLLDEPERWLQAKQKDLLQLHRVGDLAPSMRVDFGPGLIASFLGGERIYKADTGWTPHFVDDDWSNINWQLSDDNPWWQEMVNLTKLAAEDAAGRYLVCTPNLGGTADILLNLRGSTNLNIDILDQPEKITAAVNAIYPIWHKAFYTLHEIIEGQGAQTIHWLNLWSDNPYLVVECDFSVMLSPKHFETLFLPDIIRQGEAVGRAVFHMDGPDATRHLNSILERGQIDAVQFTPGAGTPSTLPWIGMFREIMATGKPLEVICPAEEVLTLCQALPAEGLAIWVETPLSPNDLDDLYRQFCRYYGTDP